MINNRNMRDMVVASYLQLRAPILVLDLDENGMVVDANQYARKLLGQDCIGRSITMMIIDFKNRFDLARLRTHHHGNLLSFLTATGSPVSLRVSFLPLGSTGILVGEFDQHESEELQTTLIKLNSELNTISRDLQKKTIQLKQANDLKNQFLGMAAHDLRSPLAGIFAYIELLRDELRPVQGTHITEGLTEIHNEVRYMLNLVSNLLDYSIIEQGRLDLEIQAISIRELLQQAVQLNALLARKRSISIDLKIENDPGEVRLDLNRIRQVLNNLLSNAIKYTPEGKTVTICLSSDEKELLLRVMDQGKGVPPDQLGKLFVPFGKTTSRALSGEKSTGLGLSICKRIVEEHGGRIWEENLPEGGACFNFTLPL